jgi:hypothetical protein
MAMNSKTDWHVVKDRLRVYAPFFVLSLSLIGLIYNPDPELIIVFFAAGIIFLIIGQYISKKSETHGILHYVVTCVYILAMVLVSLFSASLDTEFIGLFIWLPAAGILIISSLFSLRYNRKTSVQPVEKKDVFFANKFYVIMIISLILISGLSLLAFIPQILPDEFTQTNFLKEVKSITFSFKYVFISVLLFQVLFLLLLIGIVLIRAIIKYLGIATRYAGSTVPVRIISLGFIVLLFPEQVMNVFKAPFNLFASIIYSFLGQLDKISNSTRSLTSPNWFDEIIRSMPRNAVGIIDDVYRHFLRFLNDLTIDKLILAIACWIIVGQLIDFIIAKEPSQSERNWRLSQFFGRINPSTRQNILLMVVFIISGYLSIAAIVAIPWMAQGNVPKEIEESRVNELKILKGTQKEFEDRFNDFGDANPFEAIEENSIPSQEFKNQKLNDRWRDLVNYVTNEINFYKRKRADTIEKWKPFRQKAWERMQELEQSAINSFKSQIKYMGIPEQEYYFREVFNWHSWNVAEIIETVKDIRSQIIRNDGVLSKFSKFYKDYLDKTRIDFLEIDKEGSDPYTSFGNPPRILSEDFKYVVFELPEFRSTPAPPKAGSQWGVFGMASGWLLKTRSFSLILITGMLGFGLFGSVTSSFIRQQTSHTRGDPLVPDLPFAVVRGLSAAVVVFLAVEGGIAIFTAAEPQPNPYVLFFTCLVGAVFSETVWNWAKKKLIERFSDSPVSGNEQV